MRMAMRQGKHAWCTYLSSWKLQVVTGGREERRVRMHPPRGVHVKLAQGDSTRFSINFNYCMYSEITLLWLACELIYAASETLVPQPSRLFYSKMWAYAHFIQISKMRTIFPILLLEWGRMCLSLNIYDLKDICSRCQSPERCALRVHLVALSRFLPRLLCPKRNPLDLQN